MNRIITWAMIALCAAIIAWPFFARAEETKQMMLRKAAVCDSLDLLKDWLDRIAENNNRQVEVKPGCGYIVADKTLMALYGGIPARVTKVEVYETSIATIGIVSMDFTVTPFGRNLGMKYGYGAVKYKEPGEGI